MSPTAPNPYEVAAVALEKATWTMKPQWTFGFAGCVPGTDSVERAWLEAELPHRPLLDLRAAHWVQSRQMPTMTDEQAYWFRIRFVAAYSFLQQFVLADGSSIFPFPPMKLPELLTWMLTDWWAGVGAQQAFFYIVEPEYELQIARGGAA